MAKTSGGTRKLTNGSREYNRRLSVVNEMRSSGLYSSVEFEAQGGGFVAIEKANARHKPEEIEAAHILARNGYQVILLSEDGQARTRDGRLITIGEYEQKTPALNEAQLEGREPFNAVANMRNALHHAKDKSADIAVVYMKNNLHDVNSVKGGIAEFEKASTYRFKEILILTSDGRIHRHKHNN